MSGKAKLEKAQYMLKADELMLHPEFLQRLRSLPQTYVYGEYRQIYRDFGTHYVTEATLGGEYEHTIILDKELLEKSGEMIGIINVMLLTVYFFFFFSLIFSLWLQTIPWINTTTVCRWD